MKGIAVAALTDGRQNSIPKEVFEARISELYERIPQSALEPGRDEVRSLAVPAKIRFVDLPNPVEACVNAVRTHGVIEHDVTRQRHYRFSHKSFCEVLAAEVLRDSIIKDDDISAAIEQANSISAIDLADQTQIVEFVADFLGTGTSGVHEVSYIDLYRRIFPSRFNHIFFVRARSILSALMCLFSLDKRFKKYKYLIAAAAGFSGTYLGWQISFGEQIHPDLTEVLSLASAVTLATLVMLFAASRFPRYNALARFNLLRRLCQLFEKAEGHMYSTDIERRGHNAAAMRLEEERDMFDVLQTPDGVRRIIISREGRVIRTMQARVRTTVHRS